MPTLIKSPYNFTSSLDLSFIYCLPFFDQPNTSSSWWSSITFY